MKNYIDLVNFILKNGSERFEPRTKSSILSCFNAPVFVHNNEEGYPLLTSKKMHYKSIWAELEWFIKGKTDLNFLLEKNCNIWNADAFRHYSKSYADHLSIPVENLTMECFLNGVKSDSDFFPNGCDLGPIYGKQWRDINGIDQLKNLVDGLIKEPYSRRHIVNSWNISMLDEMALPPCHMTYQCYVRDDKNGNKILDLKWYQRSVNICAFME